MSLIIKRLIQKKGSLRHRLTSEMFSPVAFDHSKISAPVIAKKRFGINSLIGRMTNGSGNINTEDNLEERKEPTMPGVGGDIEFDDDERIEVPAFLRRQAN